MIAEWIEYLTTPCPRYLRRMGYLRESIGIRSRYRRHAGAWAAHLENSKRVIGAGIAACDERRKAVVFGAGLIYDLPLADLSAAFDEVVLVDLVHLRPARQAARRWANIRLAVCDLTASLAGFHQGNFEVGSPADYLDDPAVGYVVSANVVSQLPVLPLEWLGRRFALAEPAGQDLARRLVQGHLDYLRKFACPVCLISDTARIYSDGQGREIERDDALHGVELGPVDEAWSWPVAPPGELDRRYGLTNEVAAVRL